MIWIYPFLVALLLQIAAAQTNPFTAAVHIVINKPFTISWDPTTKGTVTLTIIAINSYGVYFRDLLVLAANLPNSGSFTGTIGGTPPSTSCSVKIVSDEDPTFVSYSVVFNITEDTSKATRSDTLTTLETVTVHTTVKETPTSIPPADPTPSQSAISSSTTTTATAAASADTTPASSLLPSETSTPSSTKGLSAGAAAGIGVGSTLGALILLSIGGFFWWRGRKRAFGPETETSAGADAGAGALETEESKSRKRASELEGEGKMPVELQGTPMAELG
ncbi:hypothetical protein VE02_07141 [Pseudogymnoascus sp. 03VT05]|nr:hypothetical protein VE02_07141 [Pseudogymnoascus sp. 03VT05]